jgi:hypothetical protein
MVYDLRRKQIKKPLPVDMCGIQEPVGRIPRKADIRVSGFIIHEQVLPRKGEFEENHENLNTRNSFLFVGIGFFQNGTYGKISEKAYDG